jgi:hypothetical protein
MMGLVTVALRVGMVCPSSLFLGFMLFYGVKYIFYHDTFLTWKEGGGGVWGGV